MPIHAQWIRRRRKEGRRGRRRRARDDNTRACVLPREFVDRETDTFPPLGSRRKSYARPVHVIETKGHAASIHIDEHAKHYRIRAPRPTAVTRAVFGGRRRLDVEGLHRMVHTSDVNVCVWQQAHTRSIPTTYRGAAGRVAGSRGSTVQVLADSSWRASVACAYSGQLYMID